MIDIMKEAEETIAINKQAVQRANARRTALIVGLIAMLVYGGFLASVMIGK
jgi:hypothetical protein